MRKWYILVTILVIGIAVAALAFFLVSKTPAPDTTTDPAPRGFLSFFGRQFGFTDLAPATTTTSTSSTPEIRPTFRQRLALEKMISVSPEMISGITFTASTTATTTPSGLIATTTIEHVRFVLRETGRIEDVSLETGEPKRLTNTTVPRIQEAFFGVNGSAVAMRYLADDNETVETYVAPLSTNPFASSTELIGTFFRRNIRSVAFSPVAQELFYITTSDTGATGRISNLSGSAERVIFFSPLSEWLGGWGSPDAVFVTSKPSYRALGTGQRVAYGTGAITSVLRGTRGLTTLPNPDGTRILYSESTGAATKLFMRDLTTRENIEFLIPTLPEKCVWADGARAICAVPREIDGAQPDSWYQGSVTFTDSFWMLDGETGQVNFLFDPEETPARETVDATELHLSYNNTVLGFINKKDLRGWVADLSEWF